MLHDSAIGRRLASAGPGWRRGLLVGALLAVAAAPTTMNTAATHASTSTLNRPALKNVPRNRTLITAGWDGLAQVPNPTNFNPYLPVSGIGIERELLHYTVNESLFYTNVNTGHSTPWLAKSAKYNKKFTQVFLTLNPHVKWADGKPFTASDVAFTINTLKDNAPYLALSADMKTWVKRVKVTGAHALTITLTSANPRWIYNYLQTGQTTRFVVLPEHIWKGQNAQTFTFYDPAKGWPMGTGPFKVVDSNSSEVTLDRLSKWWAVTAKLAKHLPAIQRVIYRPASTAAQPNLYIANDLDVGSSVPSGTFDTMRARNPKLISWNTHGPTWGAPDGCNNRLVINDQQSPYNSAYVRQAINFAINRSQIASLAFEKATHPNVAPLSSYKAMKAWKGLAQSVIKKYNVGKTNLKKTASLLQSHGFKKVNGQWALSDGAAWPLTIDTLATDPVAPVLVSQLTQAGFNVVTKTLSPSDFVAAVSSGNFGLASWVICGSISDPFQTLNYYNGSWAVPPGQAVTNVRAVTRFNNAGFNKLVNKMSKMKPSTKNPKYVSLFKQALGMYLKNMPDIVLTEELQTTVFNTRYWTGWPTRKNPYMPPYNAWDGFAQVIDRLQPAK